MTTTTTFNCRDSNHYHWTYEVQSDGWWRRPGGGWNAPPTHGDRRMGETFLRRHAEAVAVLGRTRSQAPRTGNRPRRS